MSEEAQGSFIEEIRVNSVRSLIELLRPSHRYWSGPHKLWGFRGQPDASWGLQPSAYRSTFGDSLTNKASSRAFENQVRDECAVFEEFLFLADEIGLRVPGSDYAMSEEFDSARRRASQWPHPPLMPGLALAQHHGVPTRFLDFSYGALVAAYFAAYHRWNSCPPDGYTSGSMAIWAVNLRFIHHAYGSAEGRRIDTVNVPAADNPFLQAQRAFFLWDRMANTHWPPGNIDQVILERAEGAQAWSFIERTPSHLKRWIHPPVIRKIVVNHRMTRPLLDALYYRERVSAAHLMPQLDSVRATSSFHRDLRDTKKSEAIARTAPKR
jgi:hypothetical protein